MKTTLSVIIPTLNEQEYLPTTLASLGKSGVEVIVSDGGSSDRSVAISSDAGVKVITGPPGRGQQMNRGALEATSPLLLFLHADTLLPEDFQSLVERTLADPAIALGAFSLAFATTAPGLAVIAGAANLRSRWLQLPYGDQALFTTRTRFFRAGGFPQTEIMEDFIFVRKIREYGKIKIVPEKAITSHRRWQRLGLVRTTLINQLVVLGYMAGVSPAKLARLYHRLKNRSA
ncbi:TIGR04283 family arsenosugar biosynthesis glycosyltransferase [Desulforhopalus singaporensis]|uniref:Transferase 2, rSAM/selenodomain-associated n=1 Tax=Desulforhopalus singaporensis TaxID=91360 RepID=A0A1H0SWD2_9BACT|nr:TIGR04283 family arsenosugar biosynthesis glycosyltransferase [Desulforhopalus singaporensis]SDP46053.1 transferase 2, rSAM/selenodomain-associated [Desulforhopalus singaporensis]